MSDDYEINQQDFERLHIFEHSTGNFTADASDLDFPVGQWPGKILTNIGNRMPLMIDRVETRDEDVLWVVYRQVNGSVSLKVFND